MQNKSQLIQQLGEIDLVNLFSNFVVFLQVGELFTEHSVLRIENSSLSESRYVVVNAQKSIEKYWEIILVKLQDELNKARKARQVYKLYDDYRLMSVQRQTNKTYFSLLMRIVLNHNTAPELGKNKITQHRQYLSFLTYTILEHQHFTKIHCRHLNFKQHTVL